MNGVERKLTLQQERLAYRRAVQLTLSRFFDKTPGEAACLVQAWWDRMGNGPDFTTGLFMHDEPLDTAADLAHARMPAIREVGEAYFRIIEESMPKPRMRQKSQKSDEARSAHAA